MKAITIATLVLNAHFMTSGTCFAGPYRSVAVTGTPSNEDKTIDIPTGKAITLLALVDGQSGLPRSAVAAVVNGVSVYVMQATQGSPDVPAVAAPKDVTITGPATINLVVPTGQQCVFSYKLFAN